VAIIPNYLTHWSLTQACQWTLETAHVYTGLPWWATIVGATVAFKVLTSPLMYANERALARRSLMKAMVAKQVPNMKAEIDRLAETHKIPDEKKQMWLALARKKSEKVLSARMGSHLFALFCYPILQMPIWVSVSFAIRNLSGRNPFYFEYDDLIVDELRREGLFWFSNLSIPDPLFVLPIINCILYLVNPTISTLGTPMILKKTMPYRFGRGLNVIGATVITLVALQMPAVLTLYWVTSMFSTLCIRLILKVPRVRRMLAIDRAPFESPTPVKELMLRSVGKWKPDATRPKKSVTATQKS